MARRFLFSQMRRWFTASAKPLPAQLGRAKSSSQRSNRGFTLMEVLVVALIAGGLVAGLMTIVVQLMQADQRESARTETQREMQLALDYISTELREAVYVYTGDDLLRLVEGNYLPADLSDTGTTPVLAFWKYQAFPPAVRTACASASPPAGVGCMAGQSYSLVVYALTRNPSSGSPWRGGARIRRYVLSQFQGNSLSFARGYVNPGDQGNFSTWPMAGGTNLQTPAGGRPVADATNFLTLVDFVDGQTGTVTDNPARCPGDNPANARKPYSISPPDSILNGLPRSFYACVSAPTSTLVGSVTRNIQQVGGYQDVVLYLRGSAAGRPGVPGTLTARAAEVLPTLETRVMLRGVLTRNP